MIPIDLKDAKKEKLFYVVANAVVYRPSDGRCLILKRSMREKVHPGRWALPGGKLEWQDLSRDNPTWMQGEIPESTDVIERLVAREIKEEAGITVALSFFYLGSYAFVRPDGIPVILLKYGAMYTGGDVVLEEGAFTEYAWVDEKEAQSYDCLKGIPEEIRRTIEFYETSSEARRRRITIALALIRDSSGRIFMQQRNEPAYPDAHAHWDFPGGEIDFGETPEDTLKKECSEEIGCDVEIVRMLPWARSHVWTRDDGLSMQVLALCYECRIIKGTPQSKTDETLATRWVTVDEARALNTMPGIQEFISYVEK